MSAAEIGTAVFAIVGFTSTALVCGFFALLGFYMLRDAWRKAGERAARMRKLREARKAAVDAPTLEAPLPWNPEWDHADAQKRDLAIVDEAMSPGIPAVPLSDAEVTAILQDLTYDGESILVYEKHHFNRTYPLPMERNRRDAA